MKYAVLAGTLLLLACSDKLATTASGADTSAEKPSLKINAGDQSLTLNADGGKIEINQDGNKITLNSDQNGTQISLNGNGEASESSLGMPFYPGARTAGSGSTAANGQQGAVVLVTQDSPQQVMAFYRHALRDKGSMQSVESGDFQQLTVQETGGRNLLVTIEKQEVGTQIILGATAAN